MARCGCSSKCNCLVIEGSNIVVTGNGSLANPYVITGLAPYTDEMARDAIGAALVAGSGISIVVNDAGDTITISGTTPAGDSDEQVRDVIGAALRAGAGISIVVDDPGDTITISSSLSSLGGAKSTVGAGLASFASRSTGDLHRNTTNGREYVLTGASGGSLTDPLTYADGSLVGKVAPNGQTYETLVGSYSLLGSLDASIVSNDLVGPGGSNHGLLVVVGSFASGAQVDFIARATGNGGQVELGLGLKNTDYTQLQMKFDQGSISAFGQGHGYPQINYADAAGSSTVLYGGAFVAGPEAGLRTDQDVACSFLLNPDGTTSFTIGATTRIGPTLTSAQMAALGTRFTINLNDAILRSFSVTCTGTLAWSQETEPVTPTLASLGGCKSTVGSGLPSFVGRNQGDFHYDDTTGKEHVLTGAAGAQVTDNFNRANSTGLGTSSSGTAWAARGGSAANVAGNVAVGTSGGQNYVPITAGDQTVSLSFISPLSGTADVSLVARLDSAAGTDYEGRFFYTSGTVVSLGISRGGTGALVALAATTLPYVAGHTYTLTLSVIGQNVTLTATDLNTGASTSITTTDGGTVLTGPNAGFLLNAGNGSVDDFTAFNNGTLKWTYDEPLYLSCVVPGAVTVGTHVFKPGLRIPTGPTTARRLTIRTDTAATAGGITVVGHRYNNGIDTGDTITASIASGANVGSTTAAVDTASGDMWKFDVTVANGGSDLLIDLDCF